jgi:hypothetical protein
MSCDRRRDPMCFPLTFESEESRSLYETLAARIVTALTKNQVPNAVPEPLKEPAAANA